MLELQNVSAGYRGVPVLQNVSLGFAPGEVTVLLGPNGCGKTTLLKTALGLLPPLGGTVLVDGRPLDRLTAAETAQKIAYMAQSRTVPNITAGRLVLHGRFAYLDFPRRYRRQDYAAVRCALQKADAADLEHRPLPELSGGQRQKIYLAMALAQDTPTILMDEPTSFLDVRHQLETMRTVRALARSGKAVVLVSHDLCGALRTADRVAVLCGGTLRRSGTPEEIYQSGVLEETFAVRLHRVETPDGWQYYCV